MAGGNSLWRLLLGKNHEGVRARLRCAKGIWASAHRDPRPPMSVPPGKWPGRQWSGPAASSAGRSEGWPPNAGWACGGGGALTGANSTSAGPPRAASSFAPDHSAVPQVADPVNGRRPVALLAGGGSARPSDEPVVQPFDVLTGRPREPRWVRVRRTFAVTTMVVLMLAGAVSIAGEVMGWLRTAAPATGPQLADADFDGAAELAATDYLSWDAGNKPRRQAALTRIAAPGVAVDGWDGTGRQWADSAATIGRTRSAPDHAVVVTQVRVVPFTGSTSDTALPPPSSPRDGDGSVSSAPDLSAAGWTAGTARWLTVAVPLVVRDGRPLLAATPALVGAPPALGDSSSANTAAGSTDDSFSKSTQDTVTQFLQAFATGELDFVRAPRASLVGLDKAVAFRELKAWRARQLVPGQDSAVRAGTATVTWKLPGSAGELTCSYRITLRR